MILAGSDGRGTPFAQSSIKCASRVPACCAKRLVRERQSLGLRIHGGIKAREIKVEEIRILGMISHALGKSRSGAKAPSRWRGHV
jgi:hypothetical protein